SDVACRLARIWMFSDQPETLCDSINYPVCRLQACSIGPIEEDLIKIPLSLLGDTVAHLLARGLPSKELPPSCLHPIWKLLYSFAPFIFEEFTCLEAVDARTHAAADAVKLLFRKVGKNVLCGGLC